MAADSPETNPYAPPRDLPAPRKMPRATPAAPGEPLKWIYAAVALANALVFLSIATGVAHALGIQRELITLVDGPLNWTLLGLALVWIYYAWSGIPRELRRRVTPANAVVGFFIPFFGIYWVFAVNVHLCNYVDALLARAGDPRRAPKALAVVATLVHFVPLLMVLTEAKPYAFLAVITDHALWVAYMVKCDALRRVAVSVGFDAEPSASSAPATAERDEYDEKLDKELRHFNG